MFEFENKDYYEPLLGNVMFWDPISYAHSHLTINVQVITGIKHGAPTILPTDHIKGTKTMHVQL